MKIHSPLRKHTEWRHHVHNLLVEDIMVTKNAKSDRLIYQAVQYNKFELQKLAEFRAYLKQKKLTLPPKYSAN